MAKQNPPDRNNDLARLKELVKTTSIQGVKISKEPLWEKRAQEIMEWLPPEIRKDIVTAYDAVTPKTSSHISAFAKQHSLTRAEARVIKSLVDGHSLADHAQSHGISINTARVHMQRILDKTGARRQADLIRMILS